MYKYFFLIVLFNISCATNSNLLDTLPESNILIYTAEWQVESNLGDIRYKNKLVTAFTKINKNEKTIQFSRIKYDEGKRKDYTKIDIDSLFKKEPVEYFKIKSKKLKTRTYVTKYKRGWFDFATPGRSKSGGDIYYINKDSTIGTTKINIDLTAKANRK
jgi:hypothetical protein